VKRNSLVILAALVELQLESKKEVNSRGFLPGLIMPSPVCNAATYILLRQALKHSKLNTKHVMKPFELVLNRYISLSTKR